MVMLNQVTGVKVDELYELKRAHPIVDFVSHLTASGGGEEWLVFIHILLQPYKKHKAKLVDMFKRSSGNTKNKSWSLYTEYRSKYSIVYKNSSKKILLLYILPRELDLTQFYHNIGAICPSICQNIHVGLLATGAPFYKEMMNFQSTLYS